MNGRHRRARVLTAVASVAVLVTATLVNGTPASAHIERPSYWPLPGADCTISPCAGGAVPTARTLASATTVVPNSTTRVVCKPNSLALLQASITSAVAHGYNIRPTDHRTFTAAQGTALMNINTALFAMCTYNEIQPAVTASHNNDRVVIMPGVYTEPTARAKPTNDPACVADKITDNTGGDISGAVSYAYQVHCPNDQNLIAVLGRGLGVGSDPHPPLVDRHGIPNLGPCIRCNLQMEGSGVSSDDVVIDAGNVASGNGPPIDAKKDVGIRADRADGFVLRNVNVRHAEEHAIYIIETDGYLLDRFKTFWAGDYGVLTFVADHGLMQNCEATGSGDSGLYPGAGAKTSTGRDTHFYPTSRYSQQIRFCDSHHNLAGYSGTDGSAVHVDHNNFYDNALGFTTDVFTAAGHPGFPQQGDLVEYNNFYSNNFNPYLPGSLIEPLQPEPVGTGMWIAGGNDNVVRYNHFYDNWRRGAMLFAVPDATICGPVLGSSVPVPGCDPLKFSTSYRNKFYGNVMGKTPTGLVRPNGVDFWWDSFPTNTGNCWYSNTAAPGKRIVTSPPLLPNCVLFPSIGLGSTNEVELLACFGASQLGGFNPLLCPWFNTPRKPGTSPFNDPLPGLFSTDPVVRSAVCSTYSSAKTAMCGP